MVEVWKKKYAYIGFVYIPAKVCDLKGFTIFKTDAANLLFNAVTKSQNKIALKYVVILYLVKNIVFMLKVT